jgi:capsular polysaccharide biosynthesis protein
MTTFVLDASYPSLEVALRLDSSRYVFVVDRPIEPPQGHRALRLNGDASFFAQLRQLREAWREAGGKRCIVLAGRRARTREFLRNLALARAVSSQVVIFDGEELVPLKHAWGTILRATIRAVAEPMALWLYVRIKDGRLHRQAGDKNERSFFGCYTQADTFSLPPDHISALPHGPSLYGSHTDGWYLPRFSHAPARCAVTTTRHRLKHVALHVQGIRASEVSTLHRAGRMLDYPYLAGSRPIRRFNTVSTTRMVRRLARGINLLYFTSGYYHWIIEGIPRVLDILDDGFDLDSWPLCLPPMESYQKEFLTLMGVVPDRHVIVVRKGDWCHLDECVFPTAYFPFGVDGLEDPSGWPDAGVLHRIRERVLERLPPPAETGKRIYVSRQQAAKRKFTPGSAAALAEALGAIGFQSVLLETLSWPEQIQLFAGADFVVAPHGAGLANLTFSRARALVEIHNPVETRPYFATIARELGMEYGYAIARLQGESPYYDNMTIDAAEIVSLVDRIDRTLRTRERSVGAPLPSDQHSLVGGVKRMEAS